MTFDLIVSFFCLVSTGSWFVLFESILHVVEAPEIFSF